MTLKTEALKLALELAKIRWDGFASQRSYADKIVIDACEKALAQPEQEPVAWMSDQDVGFKKSEFGATATVPLYTTPPKRPWVGLTDEEIEEAYAKPTLRKMYQAIEAKLKELNT